MGAATLAGVVSARRRTTVRALLGEMAAAGAVVNVTVAPRGPTEKILAVNGAMEDVPSTVGSVVLKDGTVSAEDFAEHVKQLGRVAEEESAATTGGVALGSASTVLAVVALVLLV